MGRRGGPGTARRSRSRLDALARRIETTDGRLRADVARRGPDPVAVRVTVVRTGSSIMVASTAEWRRRRPELGLPAPEAGRRLRPPPAPDGVEAWCLVDGTVQGRPDAAGRIRCSECGQLVVTEARRPDPGLGRPSGREGPATPTDTSAPGRHAAARGGR
jgi:hypothetical protein